MENITVGQLSQFLISFTSILTAGGIVCGFALKIGKKILANNLRPFNERIDEMEKARIEQHKETKNELNEVRKELNENSLNTMKNTICNELIPLSERIDVGSKYIEKGGNGAVKLYYHQLEERYENELKGGKSNEKNKIKR